MIKAYFKVFINYKQNDEDRFYPIIELLIIIQKIQILATCFLSSTIAIILAFLIKKTLIPTPRQNQQINH